MCVVVVGDTQIQKSLSLLSTRVFFEGLSDSIMACVCVCVSVGCFMICMMDYDKEI